MTSGKKSIKSVNISNREAPKWKKDVQEILAGNPDFGSPTAGRIVEAHPLAPNLQASAERRRTELEEYMKVHPEEFGEPARHRRREKTCRTH